MMIKTCPICDGSVEREVKNKVFEYKNHSIEIPNYVTYKCVQCGESIVDKASLKESGKRLKDFQREVDGLLPGERIKRIRESLGLTQNEMSEILGGGAKGFAKYESNMIAQSKAMDNLLRILEAYPNVLTVIMKDKPLRHRTRKIINIDGYLEDKYGKHKYETEVDTTKEKKLQIR